MNANIQIFNSPDFGEIRTTISEKGEPLFCLADVCKSLEIANNRNEKDRLNPKGVHSMDTLTSGGLQSMTYIDEGNLYKE
jgi:prophage antirepressor-like protein